MKHAIYRDILDSIGWFDTGLEVCEPIDASVNFTWPADQMINNNTVVAYYPGCFAEFHDGHLAVIKHIQKSLSVIYGKNFLVVIAPANSDYTISKYGDVEQASNKYRYEKIKKALEGLENVCIDLNPMLNFDRDHNFPDLIEDFLRRHGHDLLHMWQTPYVICGKDRDFSKLRNFTELLDVLYIEGNDESSSALMKLDPKPRKKKTCILRCYTMQQKHLFWSFFREQYQDIVPSLIVEERVVAGAAAQAGYCTVCKDYADLMPYVRVSRKWLNPLEQSSEFLCDTTKCLPGTRFFDSDVYSGSTRAFLESVDCHVMAIHNIVHTDKVEIVDWDDIVKWKYPEVDVASRCSMRPFTKEDHELLERFQGLAMGKDYAVAK